MSQRSACRMEFDVKVYYKCMSKDLMPRDVFDMAISRSIYTRFYVVSLTPFRRSRLR